MKKSSCWDLFTISNNNSLIRTAMFGITGFMRMQLRIYILLLMSCSAWAEPPTGCLQKLSEFEAQHSKETVQLYRTIDPQAAIGAGNDTQLSFGAREDRAVLIVHGFSASPWEVASVAEAAKVRGLTTLSPLVRGFGATAQIANAVAQNGGFKVWSDDLRSHFEALAACYPRVDVVGISMGGALGLDLLESPASAKISTLTFLSPLFKLPEAWLSLIERLGHMSRDTVDLKDLYAFSHSKDLAIPMAHPEHFLQAMPLTALRELSEGVDGVRSRFESLNSQIPALLAISESDRTVDWEYARVFQQNHFVARQEILFTKDRAVPHQISVSHEAYDSTELAGQVADFIQSKL